MRLFDTHCHLDDPRFADDFDEVLARARDAGVTRMTTIGCARDRANVRAAYDVAAAQPNWIRTTIGVHPHDASALGPSGPEAEALEADIAALAADPLVVAVGEMGLDYHYDSSPRDVQRDVFRRQIALARAVRKPIIVHTREAAADTLRILREERASEVGGIIHCFSEDAAFARAALDLGFVSSFSGIVTFKKATAIQEAAATQPADAILIETDAPYLAPIPKRGRRNEPAYVAHTAKRVAELRGEDPEAFVEQTFANAMRVFGLEA